VAQAVEHLPSKSKALSSNPVPKKLLAGCSRLMPVIPATQEAEMRRRWCEPLMPGSRKFIKNFFCDTRD
jgi:hypothetical protein